MDMPIFDKYEIVEKIATHQDKAIYRIKDSSGALYVAKVYKKTYKHPLYKSLSKLTHENMPMIHEVTLLEDCFYVIEDCIDGRTLREILDDSGVLAKKEMLGILMQLCDVLAYLHNQPTPIIHRDITPANIMITDSGTVKLIDFDIAREHKDDATADTELIGTKYFAPPEQYGFSQSDPRTDIYALGMLMVVMLTNTYEVQRVKDAQTTSVIERCMMLSPDKRFQTVKKLRDRLERISNNKLEPHVKAIAASVILIFSAMVLFVVLSGRTGEGIGNRAADARLEYIRLVSFDNPMYMEDVDLALNPPFDSGVFDYIVYVPYDFGTFHMGFGAYNHAASAVLYVGGRAFWEVEDFIMIVSLGLSTDPRISYAQYLPVGEEIVMTIIVTSEDGTTSETYVVRYIRQVRGVYTTTLIQHVELLILDV